MTESLRITKENSTKEIFEENTEAVENEEQLEEQGNQ